MRDELVKALNGVMVKLKCLSWGETAKKVFSDLPFFGSHRLALQKNNQFFVRDRANSAHQNPLDFILPGGLSDFVVYSFGY